jgi:O-antigen/teichoic acid export membrane protein
MSGLLLSLVSMAVRLVGAGVQFLLSLLILKLGGLIETGSFFSGLMIATAIAVLGKTGTDVALVQYLPGRKLGREEERRILAKIIKRAGKNCLLLTVLVIGVVYSAQLYFGHNLETVMLMCLSATGMAMNMVFAEYLKAKGKVITAGFAQFVGVPSVVCVALLIAIQMQAEGIIANGALHWAITWAIVCMVQFVWAAQYSGRKISDEGEFAHYEGIKLRGLQILKVHVLGFAISWMDLILANFFYTQEAVGQYGIISKLAMIATFVTVAITSVFGRRISAAHNNEDKAEMVNVYRESRVAGWAMIVPMLCVVALLHNEALSFVDNRLSGVSFLLVMMTVAQAASLFYGPANFTIMMMGRSAVVSRTYLAGVIVMVLTSLTLQSAMGIYAVSAGVMIGHVFINTVSYGILRKWMRS